jgi:hypothetical protein
MTYSLFDDPLVIEQLRELKKKWNYKSIIETGTCWAESALIFMEFTDFLHTIENNIGNYNASIKNISNAGYLLVAENPNCKIFQKEMKIINLWFGNSPDILKIILNKIKTNGPFLFFLDAHWQKYQPLRDELKEIANAKISNCYIMIHDFETPLSDGNKSQFLYDAYFGIKLDLKYVKDRLDEINPNFNLFYNTKCEGSKRGILFVEPK